jgi:hypothetical protein
MVRRGLCCGRVRGFSKQSQRDCPKRVGGAHSAALQDPPKALVVFRLAAKSTLGALLVPLFGQSRKVNSPNFRFYVFSEVQLQDPA